MLGSQTNLFHRLSGLRIFVEWRHSVLKHNNLFPRSANDSNSDISHLIPTTDPFYAQERTTCSFPMKENLILEISVTCDGYVRRPSYSTCAFFISSYLHGGYRLTIRHIDPLLPKVDSYNQRPDNSASMSPFSSMKSMHNWAYSIET